MSSPSALSPRAGRPRARTVERARDEERARTRAWLHDHTLQMLEYIAAGGYDDVTSAERLREIAALAADELRGFIGEHDGDRAGEERPRAEADLASALGATVASLSPTLGRVEVVLDERAPLPRLDPAAVGCLTAAAREALNNVARHAGAARAVLSCDVDPTGAVLVEIRDDGAGFDPANVTLGLGLTHSLAGRMAAAGGDCTVDSAPGAGTRVSLRLPVAAVMGSLAA